MYRDQEQRDFARGLRNQPTDAEQRLWHFLCAEKLGVKFRRQAAIGPYVVDFACFAKKLIVELDGPQHREALAQAHDAQRDAWLAAQGFRTVRFRNQELDEDLWGVVEQIRALLEHPLPSPPHKGEGEEGTGCAVRESAPPRER